MRIEVLHNYGGARTGGLRIAPGVYESDDPALFGLADYLVRNGHAVIIEGDGAASDKAPEYPDGSTVVYFESEGSYAIDPDSAGAVSHSWEFHGEVEGGNTEDSTDTTCTADEVLEAHDEFRKTGELPKRRSKGKR